VGAGARLSSPSSDQFDQMEVVRLPERRLGVLLAINPVLDLE
jgi:hypothetical protein